MHKVEAEDPQTVPHNGLELSGPAKLLSTDSRAQAGSAPARACVKTPNSPIAFPLRPQEPGKHTRIAPILASLNAILGAGAPQARVFTQSVELLCGVVLVRQLLFA